MLGSSPIGSFTSGDDFTKLVNPFSRPERLEVTVTNTLSITEGTTELTLTGSENNSSLTNSNNSVVLATDNSLQAINTENRVD